MDHAHCPKYIHAHDYLGHPHEHTHRPQAKRQLMLSIGLTGVMMVVEVVAGILTNSLALISDAGHMLTHFFALAVSLGAIYLAARPTGRHLSFGLYRTEVLAALFNGVTLLLITAYIFWEGYQRILAPEPVKSQQMLVVAVIGLLVNLVCAWILSRVSSEDLNLRSAFIHMIGDTVSSVGIVAGAIIIMLTGWNIVDPILSILIAAVILVWAVGLLRDSVRVLLETTPRHLKVEEVERFILAQVPEVKHVHDVHIWEITSRMYTMTAHVALEDRAVSEAQRVLEEVAHLLSHHFDIEHATLQLEVASKVPA